MGNETLTMAAQPQHRIQEESSTEVIYLVIPPGVGTAAQPAPKPWSLIESAALTYWNFKHGVRTTPVGQAARAMGLVAGYALVTGTLLIAGYLFKSAIGFDVVPGTHMGGYFPEIGGK